MAPIDRTRFEAEKARSLGQLLIRSARLFNEQSIALLRGAAGQEGIRATHMALFPHIDVEGTRLTTLAGRVGVSKQAVAQLVSELVTMGALQRIPDPADGRAKLIVFTETVFLGLKVLRQVEGDIELAIGPDHMTALRESLPVLLAELERRDAEVL